MEINEKIDAASAELKQIQSKVTENGKLADERRKLITDSDFKLRMLKLEITEIDSYEYPQEADVEVMVNLIWKYIISWSYSIFWLFTC